MDPILKTLADIDISEFQYNIYFREHLDTIAIMSARRTNTEHELRNRAELYFSYGREHAMRLIADREKCDAEQLEKSKEAIEQYIDRMRDIGYIDKYAAYIREYMKNYGVAPEVCEFVERTINNAK